MDPIDRRAFLKATGGAATVGTLTGCLSGDNGGNGGNGGGTGNTTTAGGGGSGGGSSGRITIGALEPISGPFAPWATPHRLGLEFAVKRINSDGGVLGGRKLRVAVADTGAEPGTADSSFRRMVEQKNAVVTTGAVSSDVGLRIAQTAAELQVPHLLHMAGADEIVNKDTKYVFRVGLLPANRFIQAQANAFQDKGYSTVGAIVADYAWGQSVKAAINEYFDVKVQIQVAPVGASSFSSYIRQFPQDIEMLIASGHPPGSVSIANQAYELGFSPEVVTGPEIPPNLLAQALSDRAMEGYVHISNSSPYKQSFKDVGGAFSEGHKMQFNTHTAYGYVTGQAIAAAIEKAGSTDPTAIADAFRQIQLDTLFAKPIQWTDYGELDQTVVLYNRLKPSAPEWAPNGSHSYEEIARSKPIPAQ